MRTLYIILASVILFCNLVSFIVVSIDYFKKPITRPVRRYIDTDEMYPDLLTPKGRKAVRKMKRFIKKHKVKTKADIDLIYGVAEIEKGKRK